MTSGKIGHIFRIGVLTAIAGIFFFWTGWHMGNENAKQQVQAAMKVDDTRKASVALLQWSKIDGPGSKVDGCIYQCINGVGHLLSGNCPFVPCAPTVQGCDSLDEIYSMPCPRPYGNAIESDGDIQL